MLTVKQILRAKMLSRQYGMGVENGLCSERRLGIMVQSISTKVPSITTSFLRKPKARIKVKNKNK